MSTMLERAAEAVRTAMGGDLPSINDCRHVARAVLAAVREPGLEVRGVCRFSTAETEWPAMIDAILNEGSTK